MHCDNIFELISTIFSILLQILAVQYNLYDTVCSNSRNST